MKVVRRAVSIIRLGGIGLGIGLLGLAAFWLADPPSATRGLWIVGMASLVALGATLLLPWARVVRQRWWWAPLVVHLAALGGTAALLAPTLVWAEIHGALGFAERAVVVSAITVLLAQLTAIGWMRWGRPCRAGPEES